MAEILHQHAFDWLELKVRRIRSRLTLFELGQLAGIHLARTSEMERGQRPIANDVVATLDREPRNSE